MLSATIPRTMTDLVEVQKGTVAGHSIVHKFGRNPDVDTGTDPEDVWNTAGLYTWQIAAQTLSVVSGSGDDASGGSGAQQINIQGLDENFNLANETILLTGAVPVVTSNKYMRAFRAFVARVGTYHAANAGAITATFSTTADTAFTIAASAGQTEMAIYTVPASKIGLLLAAHINVDTAANKTAQVTLSQCPNAHDTISPFAGSARRVLNFDGVAGNILYKPESPLTFSEKTDLWFTVESVSANDTPVAVDFELLLIDIQTSTLPRGNPTIAAFP